MTTDRQILRQKTVAHWEEAGGAEVELKRQIPLQTRDLVVVL